MSKQMFHRHAWGEPRYNFAPPAARLKSLKHCPADLMHELTSGFTTIEQICSGCGIVRYDRALGNVAPQDFRGRVESTPPTMSRNPSLGELVFRTTPEPFYPPREENEMSSHDEGRVLSIRRSMTPCGNGGEHNPDCFDPRCLFDAGEDPIDPTTGQPTE